MAHVRCFFLPCTFFSPSLCAVLYSVSPCIPLVGIVDVALGVYTYGISNQKSIKAPEMISRDITSSKLHPRRQKLSDIACLNLLP
jgi:hypothetical protein